MLALFFFSISYLIFFTTLLAVENASGIARDLMDIEDLHRLGREKRVCPFYLTRALYTEARVSLLHRGLAFCF